jgi:cytochrome b pre-mRNA-processing protein 3
MGFLFKRQDKKIANTYESIIDDARAVKLYDTFNVPDTPAGRFQMITLHAMPIMIGFADNNEHEKTQILFDMIFRDIELSFREIGVGDLGVPKKMKAYMNDFNGLLHAHREKNADHIAITGKNVFNDGQGVNKDFAQYIEALFLRKVSV